jgi:CBS domain-containing protein
MTQKLETIEVSSSAQEAAKKMRDKKISSLVVVDVNRPISIVTERDMIKKLD